MTTDADDAPGGPRKKHRHDLGQEDHGSVYAAGTTRGIQGLLGLWVALTIGLVIYTLIVVSSPTHTDPTPPPAAGATR